ncbi:type II secretion system protein [Candidatus Uhrbacteria bacterium]|nr:type II secretion system protein [Candidatus Uhrbacteria bacterium]
MKQGFTLIELIVSIALLVFLVMGSAQIFPRALNLVSRAEAITNAANLAQDQMEALLNQSYATVAVGVAEARHLVSPNFERETAVSYIDPDTFAPSAVNQGLKRVDVRVFYGTSFGSRLYEISTIINES